MDDKNVDLAEVNNTPVSNEPQLGTSAVPPVETPPVEESPQKSKKWLWALVALVVLAAIGFGVVSLTHKKPAASVAKTTAPAKVVRIGISMDTHKELRWQKDEQYLQDDAKKVGALTSVLVADGDDAVQVSQIENFISQKVDVLIVVPHSSDAVVPAIAEAHKAGIKVISYDRLALGSDVDFYVSFNNEQVGKNSAQYVVDALPAGKVAKVAIVGGAPTDNNATLIHTGAMTVLDPLVKSGKLQVVYDQPTTDWKPDLAYSNLKAFLDKGNVVDGVIAGNDGTAFGAIQALQEKGLAGKVPVTGQDADLAAVQRIVDGTQTMTNYKSVKDLAKRAIQIAVDFGNNRVPETNAVSDNHLKQVNSYLLQPVPVTKTNIMQTVVKDGWLTEKDIYRK